MGVMGGEGPTLVILAMTGVIGLRISWGRSDHVGLRSTVHYPLTW